MSVSTSPTYDIVALRQQEFPLTKKTTYLNHAGISPMPQRTRQAIQHSVTEMSMNAVAFFGRDVLSLFNSFQEDVADFINAPRPIDVCPVLSTSAALNLAAGAIDWRPGDNIILCDVEFPSNVYPWMAQEQHGVQVRSIPAQQGTLTLEALEQAVDEHTRLVTVSAFQFFTGARTDLQALGEFCRQHDILFVVDAIQAIGHTPIDVQATPIDVLATGGQKSILGLTGCGFLYVRPEVSEQMKPESVGCNAVQNYEHWLDYDLTFREGALRFMSGTPNVPGMFAITTSLTLLEELGRENIDAHTRSLAARFMDELDTRGFEIITPRQPELHGPIVTFQVSKSVEETEAINQHLARHEVMLAKHLDAAGRPYLRLSLHCYNTDTDKERFFNILSSAL